MENLGSLITLIISSILLVILAKLLKFNKDFITQSKLIFKFILILMVIWSFSLILQIFF